MIIGSSYSLIVYGSTITHSRVDNTILDIYHNNYNELITTNILQIPIIMDHIHRAGHQQLMESKQLINVFSIIIANPNYNKVDIENEDIHIDNHGI